MKSEWKSKDIEKVLLQLNTVLQPFDKYAFSIKEDGLILLGSGATANVYRAEKRSNSKSGYAIKVLGFGTNYIDIDSFRKSVEMWESKVLSWTNIVRIYDFAELLVQIDSDNKVQDVKNVTDNAEAEKTIDDKDNYLRLQFVLMEELTPVLSLQTNSSGIVKQVLTPAYLNYYNRKEFLQFATDIGKAIQVAHDRHIIHRDIKLENVFYSQKDNRFKLGDFGIAKESWDGLFYTKAFTIGYGAPEVVGRIDEKYDATADIYSFGMMLYLLLNKMRFPDAKGYFSNINKQYKSDFVPPNPVWGDKRIVDVVLKMISYSPDDRQQTMQEVLMDLEACKGTKDEAFKYRRNKSLKVIERPLLILGLVIIGTSDYLSGIEGMGFLRDSAWIGVTCLFLYMVVTLYASTTDNMKSIKSYAKLKFWIIFFVYFLVIAQYERPDLLAIMESRPITDIIYTKTGYDIVSYIQQYHPSRIGIAGMIFCVFWVVREKVLMFFEE